MRVSVNWLKELVPAARDRSTAEMAHALTLLGLEVESIDERGRELSGVVIAEVLGVSTHPSADKLRIVRVRAGGGDESVVCGAANVPAPGYRVCWARPGATLPGGRTLEAREVRGVMSPGMLCSEPELGLGEQGDGIIVLSPSTPTGVDLAAFAGIRDDVLEVNVTPNRADALSHIGIARELAIAFGAPLVLPKPPSVRAIAGAAPMDVRIADDAGCARYQARFVAELSVGESPLPLRLRLLYCGVRSISNLVDVTNYILLETGHPLHAFDLDRLDGGITVRRAKPAEPMTTLDGVERTLEPGDIVVADARGPVALAGVMGGAKSEVTAATTRVLLETATFDPTSIRRTSKRLSLGSEASYRFERGVDANGVPYAAARAVALLAEVGGGAALDAIVDRYPSPASPRTVQLSMARLRRVSGRSFEVEAARLALAKVADTVEVQGQGDAAVFVAALPTHRPDLGIEEDLVEEILRVGGLYAQPPRAGLVATNAVSRDNPEAPADRARDLLAALGLSEIAGWGFVSRAALAAITNQGQPAHLGDGIVVKNPISSDYEVMRTSLLPGLAAALGRNLARGVPDPALFEVGPVVRRAATGAPESGQFTHAAALLAGRSSGWLKPGDPLDFFDVKRLVDELLVGFGIKDVHYEISTDLPFLHPGVSAAIRASDREIGSVGELHPAVARKLGIDQRAFYFELDVESLAREQAAIRIAPPPRFPAASRDLSFWIDVAVPAATQRAHFASAGETLLRELAVLEDFRDPKYAPPGEKGMLWSMTYRADDRTLTDAEADAAHARVVAAIKQKFGIRIR